MTSRRVIAVVLLLAAGFIAYRTSPGSKRSPEDEVRALVAQMIDAAGKRDISAVTEPFADTFRAGNGMTGQEIRRYITGLLLRSPKGVAAINPTLEVTIDSPTSGSFRGTFLFAQEGTDLGSYEISAKVIKSDGRWQLQSAEWTR